MHLILVGPEVLASAHQLVASGAPSLVSTLHSLFIDDCHLVEVVLSKVEMLSCLRLHFLAIVEIGWQLLYLKTVLVGNFMCHAAILWLFSLLVIIIKWDFRMALVRGHFGAVDRLLVPHVKSIYVLLVVVRLLSLS